MALDFAPVAKKKPDELTKEAVKIREVLKSVPKTLDATNLAGNSMTIAGSAATVTEKVVGGIIRELGTTKQETETNKLLALYRNV